MPNWPRSRRRYDRYTHLAMAAAKTAMADGALDASTVDSRRFGVLVGSGVGGLQAVEESCRKLLHHGTQPPCPTAMPRRPELVAHALHAQLLVDRILFNKGPKRISPFLLPSIIGNTAGSMIAIELGAKGPNFGVVSTRRSPRRAAAERPPICHLVGWFAR